MRVHPISIALRYLKGEKCLRAAPYYGRPTFRDETAAANMLRELTGQDFGTDAAKWGQWLRMNRRVYRWNLERGFWVTVTKTGPAGTFPWRVRADDGRLLWAVMTAKVHTLKVPTLQVGGRLRVEPSPTESDVCRVVLENSPVIWVPRKRIQAKRIR